MITVKHVHNKDETLDIHIHISKHLARLVSKDWVLSNTIAYVGKLIDEIYNDPSEDGEQKTSG